VVFDLTFFPTHILGLPNRPRRIYTYQPRFAVGWSGSVRKPQLVPAGCRLPAAGFLLFFIDIMRSMATDSPADSNPWSAATL